MTKKKIAAVLICAAAMSLTLPGCGAGKKTESKAQESGTSVTGTGQADSGSNAQTAPEEATEPWAYTVNWNSVPEKDTDIVFIGDGFSLPLEFRSLLLHVTDLDFKCVRNGGTVTLAPEDVPGCEECLIDSENKTFAIDGKPFRISLYDTERQPLKDIVSEERFELSIESTEEIFGMDASDYKTPSEFLDAVLEKYGSPSYVSYYETAKDTSPQFIWERNGYGFGLTYLDLSNKKDGSQISGFTSFYYSGNGLKAFTDFCTGPRSKQRLVSPVEYIAGSSGTESGNAGQESRA